MIPQCDLSWQTQSWQEQMMNAVSSSKELLALLDLRPEDVSLSEVAAEQFPLLAPLAFVSRMKKGDPDDPLLRQILNLREEDKLLPSFSSDPLNESDYNPAPGLIRKYKNRALLIVTGKCALHCRYCFRREFPYTENNPSRADWQQAIDYLNANPEIDEIVLSGGDPLSASDKHLRWLTDALAEIGSLQNLRFHTRLPVAIPDRVTTDFLELLEKTRFNTTLVVHINHAAEIDDPLRRAMRRVKSSVDFLLNQSVLLRGVNDSITSQIELQHACVEAGVMPYYLHFLDPINGAAHFEVNKTEALDLYQKMQASLSGYMLPKLVWERPGAESKTFLTEST